VLHLDKVLADLVTAWGPATYAALFGIVFAETGLVITPFLPGDSLLFATGALAAMGRLDVVALAATFIAAATLGDAVNYAIGSTLGSKALHSSLIKPDHVAKTRDFYAKYGGKTVVLARFVPIVRTFAPFVAGVGSMPYGQFALYNVAGAVLWTAVCVGAGFAFGNVPAVQENFGALVLGIVAVSLLPVAYEVWAARKSRKKGGCGASGRAGREPGGQALASTFRL
jgi:membrane-associated protein